MSQIRRRVAVAAAAALALGLSVGSAGSAGAAPTDPPSYATSWLSLNTGTSNTVRLVKASGATPTTTATQSLRAAKGCALTTTPSLLSFTGDPALSGAVASAGFSGGALGVRESSTSSGASCSAVDFANGESLTLQLGNVGGLVAASASLDIDLKQSARIVATATLSTQPNRTPHYFELQSGASIGLPPDEPGAEVFTCNNPADSGPDAGIRNNCRWEISAPTWTSIAEDGIAFDTLELRPLSGSFSLMGGAEGPVVGTKGAMPDYFGTDDKSASVFELIEGVVGCGETANLRTSASVPSSTWKRLDNFGTTETDPCVAYPYVTSTGTLAKGKPFAKFTKPLEFQPTSQALWTTTFVLKGNTVPDIIVDLDLPGGGTKTFDPLPDCNADSSWYDGSGQFIGPPEQPETPTACLVSGVRGTTTATKDLVTYQVYVYGDAVMRR